MALVPPEAPLQTSGIASVLYTAGQAETALGAAGWVLLRTELVDTYQPEKYPAPEVPRVRTWRRR